MLTWFDQELAGLALSRSPGSAEDSRDDDLAVIASAGITRVVCLQQAHELDWMDETLEERRDAVESLGMTFVHEPVEDFEAPSLEQAQRIVASIEAALASGEKVLVHCQAGLGRAGTIAACVLVGRGMSASGAIGMVRYVRFGAIQSEAQEELIAAFARVDWQG